MLDVGVEVVFTARAMLPSMAPIRCSAILGERSGMKG